MALPRWAERRGAGVGAVTSCLWSTGAVAVPVPKATGAVWLAQERIPELTLVQLGEAVQCLCEERGCAMDGRASGGLG